MIEKGRGAKKLRKKHREEEKRGKVPKKEKKEKEKETRASEVGCKKRRRKKKREEEMTGMDEKNPNNNVYEINTIVSLFHGKMPNVCKSTSRAFQEHQQFTADIFKFTAIVFIISK